MYDSLNFIPPKDVAEAAALGLKYREKAGGKGGLSPSQAAKEGIGSGVQRAVNLKNRDKLSPSTVKRMKAFFSRHRKNRDIAPEYKGQPWKDRGWVAWLLWGGDPGDRWSTMMVEKMNRLDSKKACISMALRRASSLITAFRETPKNISYSAIVLDEASKAKLVNVFKDKIPQGWEIIAHHMTLKMGALPDNLVDDIGKTYNLTAEELGVSDKAMAIKVSGYKPLIEQIPHITIAVNRSGGGKPKDSGAIKDWEKIPHISLTGSLEEVPFKKLACISTALRHIAKQFQE